MANRLEIKTEEEYDNFKKYLEEGVLPSFESMSAKKIFIQKTKKMRMLNQRIYIESLNSEPLEYLEDFKPDKKTNCIQEVHSVSHRGEKALFNELKQKYYNIKLADIKRVLQSCQICSRRTVETQAEATRPIIIREKLGRLQVDITYMVDYAESNNGFKYILTIIDCYSKYAWAFPCLYKSADEVYFHLENLFHQCYVPRELHTDNGAEFRNRKISALCHQFRIRHIFGAPYHPQSQGQIERFNFTLKRMLISIMQSKGDLNWINILNRTIYEYNIKLNRSVNSSPISALLGIRGFNTDSNLLENNNTLEIHTLTSDEITELGDFKYRYFIEIGNNISTRRRRRGQEIPRITRE